MDPLRQSFCKQISRLKDALEIVQVRIHTSAACPKPHTSRCWFSPFSPAVSIVASLLPTTSSTTEDMPRHLLFPCARSRFTSNNFDAPSSFNDQDRSRPPISAPRLAPSPDFYERQR